MKPENAMTWPSPERVSAIAELAIAGCHPQGPQGRSGGL